MIAKNILNGMGSWLNQLTGQGSVGDHGGAGSIACRPERSPLEISELLMHAPLIRVACEIYAEDITRAWREHTSQPARWLAIEEEFEFRDVVEKAIFYAEGYGGAFIMPRFAESAVEADALAKPRPSGQKGLLGFAVYAQHELTQAPNTQHQLQPNKLPMYYTLVGLGSLKIHHSWVYALRGAIKVPESVLTSQVQNRINCLGQSRVDIIYDDFARMTAGYSALSHILVKGNIDVLKIKGLAEALSRCDTTEEMQSYLSKVVIQSSATVTGANTYQPIVIDTEESLERKGGNHTGAADIVRELQTMFVAATRIPRTRLMGEQAKGLNNGGEADLVHHYDRCASYRERRCTGLLNWLDAIAAPNVRTKWDYKPLYEMSAAAIAEVNSKVSETDTKYQVMGVPGIVEAIYKRLRDTEQYELPTTMPAIVQPQEGV